MVTYYICNPPATTLSHSYALYNLTCVSNDVGCVATFHICNLCDICDSKGSTFKYGLTTIETRVAILVTLLHLEQGL